MKTNWPVKKLGEVLLLMQNGVNPKQGDSGKYPISRIETVQNNAFNPGRVKFADLTEEEFGKYKYELGDIAFSHINSYEKIGKVALYDGEIKDLVHGVNLLRLKPKKEICLPEYLFSLLQTKRFRSEIDPYINKAVNQASINQTSLRSRTIPLPSISIQKKIVERLEAIRKAQELCEAQIQKTEELFESLTQNIKQGIDKKRKLAELVSFKTGKLDSNAATKLGRYPFFTCAEEIFKIDTYAFDTECVLLAGNNASGVFPIKYFSGKFNAYQRTYIIESLDKKSLETLYLYFMLRLELENLRKRSVGGLTKFLTLGILRNIKIPFPNIRGQRKIVEKLEGVQSYKKLLLKQKALLKELFGSVLDKSMNGEMDN